MNESATESKLSCLSNLYNPRGGQTSTNQNNTVIIFHNNKQYRQTINSADFQSINSVGHGSRARSTQVKKRSDIIARANPNFRSVMRTLVQKNNPHDKRTSMRGKYDIRHN